MSLFTSSSELKVIAAVMLVLGAVELSMRAVEDRLSLDLKHMIAIPSIVEQLQTQSAPRVIFLGNSLMRVGILPRVVGDAWPEAPSIARIHPDDTRLLDWYYVYKRYLGEAKPRPNLIVVSFVRSWLDDNQHLHVARLGSHYAGFRFAPEAFEQDVQETGARVEFVLAAMSHTIANRERVQSRVLAMIPGYERLADAINRDLQAKGSKQRVHSGTPSYTQLRRFLAAAHARGDRVSFVAMPQPNPYTIADDLRGVIREGGATLIDMQNVEPFSRNDFPDGLHLSEAAAPRFSRALAHMMAENEFVRSALHMQTN